jgi:hypothetical protein
MQFFMYGKASNRGVLDYMNELARPAAAKLRECRRRISG